jgi:hypothetical protein
LALRQQGSRENADVEKILDDVVEAIRRTRSALALAGDPAKKWETDSE